MSREEKEITLKDIHNDLKEVLKWMRFSGLNEVKSVLESNLQTDEEKIIFSLSDGVNSSYDIAKIMGANDNVRRKISNYWDKWEKAALGEPQASSGRGNRFKYSFNLDDFGIKIPELPKQNPKQSVSESTQTIDTAKIEGNDDGN